MLAKVRSPSFPVRPPSSFYMNFPPTTPQQTPSPASWNQCKDMAPNLGSFSRRPSTSREHCRGSPDLPLPRLHGRRLGPLQDNLIKHVLRPRGWGWRGIDKILRFTVQLSISSYQVSSPTPQNMATEMRERGNALYKQVKLPQGEYRDITSRGLNRPAYPLTRCFCQQSNATRRLLPLLRRTQRQSRTCRRPSSRWASIKKRRS